MMDFGPYLSENEELKHRPYSPLFTFRLFLSVRTNLVPKEFFYSEEKGPQVPTSDPSL